MADVTKNGKRKQALTRPIRNKRDLEAAMSVTQRLLAQPNRDTAAELRLKALLREMDRYEETEKTVDEDLSDAADYSGPNRRWSDDS
jgi:antitoxin component HigA of HigAB toxin-antitoxin module